MKIEHRYHKYPNGTEEYGIIGTSDSGVISFSLHREDGPAIVAGYYNQWFLNGIEYYNPKDMPLSLFIAYCKWKYKKRGN